MNDIAATFARKLAEKFAEAVADAALGAVRRRTETDQAERQQSVARWEAFGEALDTGSPWPPETETQPRSIL